MPRINVLPKNIAELIAAGEVVERPSSVVKEFVENSIDAGSRKIVVEIHNGGKTYIRVTDDGCGIDREDIRKAFVSHATSKISSVEDLDAIGTLGFRGEALASVCAVSRVEILTATPEDEVGTRYVIEGGEELLLDDAGCPTGTTLVVRDLFYNIPARLKFLKKDVQEGNYIAALLEKIAISNPEISFRFIRDGKLQFSTPGDGDLKSAIYSVFGREFTEQLISVNNEYNGVSVSGYVTKPVSCRNSRSMQMFYVNGRYVKNITFMSALEAAYKNSVMVGKYPGCVLFVKLPFEAVDVNVHPAKTEVRFYDEKRLFDCIYHGVASALEEDTSRVQASFRTAKIFMDVPDRGEQLKIKDVTPATPTIRTTPTMSTNNSAAEFNIKEYGSPVTGITNELHSSTEKDRLRLDFLNDEYLKPVEKTIVIENNESDEKYDTEAEAPVINIPVTKTAEIVEEAVPEPEYRYIGEAFSTYLMAEYEGKLVFIDKHAAHERILFEKLKKEAGKQSQYMLVPVTVNLSPDEYSAVLENLDLLNGMGYEIDDFGDRCVKVNACPSELVDCRIDEIVTEVAGYLASNIKTLLPEKLDWIYNSMACRAAVKAGNFTSDCEAEKFVGEVLKRTDIRYCPHGRPVLIEITQKEIEKQFGRLV